LGVLASYVRPDGRVARPDQGDDTVSEGQAYGLLLAEANGDDATFRRIWGWTCSARTPRTTAVPGTRWGSSC
jgi:endoglucanase